MVLDYTAYDKATGLFIAAKIYDVTSGTASLVTTVALAHVLNGSYFAQYTFTDSKEYLVNICVYTSTGYTTTNDDYTPSATAVQKSLIANIYTALGIVATDVANLQSSALLATDSRLDYLDNYISSRVASTDTRLDNLDATISSRVATADARLAHLDADISTRLATSGYTAPDNADITAIKTKTDTLTVSSGAILSYVRDSQLEMKRAAAFPNFTFPMSDSSTNLPKLLLVVTTEISKDGGTFVAATNTPVEIGNGMYAIDLTATETDAASVIIKFSASGAFQRTVSLYPRA